MRVAWIVVAAAAIGCGVGGGMMPGAMDNGGGGTNGGGGAGGGGTNGGGSDGGATGGGTALDLYQSGSRLKLKVLTTADGAKAFQGWYDTQLGLDCQFVTASDGQLRCLPIGTAYVGSFYADGNCTTRLAYATCAGATPPAYAYATAAAGSSCAAAYHVYAVAGAYSGTVWAGSPGACTMTTPPPGYSLFTVGGEAAASSFVAGAVAVQ